MEQTTLEKLRRRIDGIDAKIVALLTERMAVSADVSDYKRQNGLPVRVEAREHALLEQVAKQAGQAHADAVQSIYRTILKESRAYQNRLLGLPSEQENE